MFFADKSCRGARTNSYTSPREMQTKWDEHTGNLKTLQKENRRARIGRLNWSRTQSLWSLWLRSKTHTEIVQIADGSKYDLKFIWGCSKFWSGGNQQLVEPFIVLSCRPAQIYPDRACLRFETSLLHEGVRNVLKKLAKPPLLRFFPHSFEWKV